MPIVAAILLLGTVAAAWRTRNVKDTPKQVQVVKYAPPASPRLVVSGAAARGAAATTKLVPPAAPPAGKDVAEVFRAAWPIL